MIGLATEVLDRLNSIRRDEERRGSRPIEDQVVQRAVKAATALRKVMPNGGSRGRNYSRGEALL